MKFFSCSKCEARMDLMFLVESLIATGGQVVRCACGHTADGGRARELLNKAMASPSVEDARKELKAKLETGTHCPCCDQFAKRYTRKISSNICQWLIAFARASGGDRTKWVHVSECGEILGSKTAVARSGDYGKARFWGLLEAGALDEEIDGDKKSSGTWRLTEKGWAFVANKLTIPQYVLVYNNESVGFHGKEVSITTGLGSRWSYSELMGPARLYGETA